MRGALAIAVLLATAGPAQHSWCDEAGTAQEWVRVDEGKTGGGYSKLSKGTLLAFDFKTKALETITPANSELSKTHNAREMVYVEHADWVLLGELYPHGERKEGAGYTRVYDCQQNKMSLLDAGDVPSGHSTGWMYDARRKLVYLFTYRGEAWALKIDPATARLVEKP